MSDELNIIKDQAEEAMDKAIDHLETELIKVRAGKANPNLVDGLVVDYYGTPTPISQVGNITVADARTLAIQPWEKICCNRSSVQSLPPISASHHRTMV